MVSCNQEYLLELGDRFRADRKKGTLVHRLRSRGHAQYLPKVPHIFSNPEAYYLLQDRYGKLL